MYTLVLVRALAHPWPVSPIGSVLSSLTFARSTRPLPGDVTPLHALLERLPTNDHRTWRRGSTNTRHTAPQILFLSGLTLIIGPHKTFYFFARKQKLRGTVCFIGGILLVFFKWPFVGVIVETFGFLNLFGYVLSIFPAFLAFRPWTWWSVISARGEMDRALPTRLRPTHKPLTGPASVLWASLG